jgi:predicted DNA-binding transcriptional regulator AlpA
VTAEQPEIDIMNRFEQNGAVAHERPASETAPTPTATTPATLDDVIREIKKLRTANEKPAILPELLTADEAARFCGMSRASWDRLRSFRMTPAPVKPGEGVFELIRWSRRALQAWIDEGCPNQNN